MKCNHNITLLAAWLTMGIICPNVQAQSREEFDAYVAQERQAFADYKAQRIAEFNRYREQYNREFAQYLQGAWTHVMPETKMAPPPQPRPFVPKPKTEASKPLPKTPREMPVFEIAKLKTNPATPQPASIIINKPKEDNLQQTVSIESFYGNDFTLRCSSKFRMSLADNSPSAIASAWRQLSSKELDPLIYDCQQARETHEFCDWMYYLFVKEVARTVTHTVKSSNEEVLLTSYILAQSGVDFRFARNETHLLLALPFDTQVYKYNYFNVDGKKYYVLDREVSGACYLMERSFCKESATLSLRMSSVPGVGKAGTELKTLKSEQYPEMSVNLSFDESLIDFYHTYPRMDWQEYALAPMKSSTKKRIVNAFRPVLSGKTEEEAANMILNFVQTAFIYGYDDEIWGSDRPFFADETLYYSQSDCEDRSILFSQLIRMLTDLDVVLLHYPSHLATAVRFTEDLPGDYVLVDGKKYLVCDPTGYYPIGNAYDEFKNVKAKVIKLN